MFGLSKESKFALKILEMGIEVWKHNDEKITLDEAVVMVGIAYNNTFASIKEEK